MCLLLPLNARIAPRAVPPSVLMLFVLLAILVMIKRHAALDSAGLLFNVMLLVLIQISAEARGGLQSTTLGWCPVCVVIGTLTLSGRNAFLMTLLWAASSFGHAFRVDLARWDSVRFGPPLLYAVPRAMACLATLGAVSIFESARKRAFAQLAAEQEQLNAVTHSLRDMMQRLELRNRDMSRVLNNVSEGLVTIDTMGVMSIERSRALTTWFGPGEPGQTLWSYLSAINPNTAECMRIGFETLLEDVFPVELALEQMPKRLVRGEQTWELGYCPIYEAEKIVSLLVVLDDATERLKAEQAEAEQRAFVAIMESILKDRSGTESFIEEAGELVLGITGDAPVPPELLARQLHTLKGNASIFGLKPLAQLCHELEDKLLANSGEGLEQADRERLQVAWRYWTERVAVFLNSRSERGISMNASEYEQMLVAVLNHAPHAKLAEMLARLRLEPTHERLARLGEQASALAARLDKGQLSVSVEENGVRVPREDWQSFWASLVHVVRNAVDHGLEGSQERSRVGKGRMPSLALSSRYAGNAIVVEIADDGRGIDWTRVAEKAKSQGLPSANPEQLSQALFADGFSTRDEVTDLSGRGVGLAAARAECERLGGKVEVESRWGQGTLFRFRVPTPCLEQIEPRLRSIASGL